MQVLDEELQVAADGVVSLGDAGEAEEKRPRIGPEGVEEDVVDAMAGEVGDELAGWDGGVSCIPQWMSRLYSHQREGAGRGEATVHAETRPAGE